MVSVWTVPLSIFGLKSTLMCREMDLDRSNFRDAFVNEWRMALGVLQECNSTKLTPLLIFYHFLNAVSANPAAHPWLDGFLNSKVSTDTTIESTFADFVVSEDRRLNSLNQAHSFSLNKHHHPLPFFCQFHKR